MNNKQQKEIHAEENIFCVVCGVFIASMLKSDITENMNMLCSVCMEDISWK